MKNYRLIIGITMSDPVGIGPEEVEDDGVPFEKKMSNFSASLNEQFAKSDQLEAITLIRKNLEVLGYGE